MNPLLTPPGPLPSHTSETYDPHWLTKKMRKTCFGDNKHCPSVAPWEVRKLIAEGKKIIEDLKAEKEAKAKAEQSEAPAETTKVIVVGDNLSAVAVQNALKDVVVDDTPSAA